MKIPRLRVRARKEARATPCAAEFATMLACWASASDFNSAGPCADAAKALQDCMRNKAVSKVPAKSTINYHLARAGKNL
ncbi:unnamed protein product [Tilletia controversa]|uniref:37S ribosomal protein mrp10, mitochondrial n=2 Tax=Tilletia TaxID=13289 RepID=A0A8X7ST96_9BASI|nr:hypothetical protein CF335_g7338 [Tilletia laevis]KAE8239527.1 hypothetical protein A4X06_0g8218 [Tilletia controversa]CAD6901744.1 unnamed protein product [Tilletia caries]CAD6911531.1 unnamed protein product [Tilletia controversa]CAD6916497.1 unnamed protein product [Tilletia caries]